ncbi:hypothetical protein GGS21DRAFT_497219 [Xylaria nigripes]|nr:hypothetical protein GGS21DRAFT_497219 [Xylaria nigripes]
MEGVLLIPERGTLLGRPVSKPRYVVVGPLPLQKEGCQSNVSFTQVLSTARIRDAGGKSSKSQQKAPVEGNYFSVYKSKEDTEPIIQHAVSLITDCQVQQIAHRKQSSPVPTLTIQVSPDPAADKLRKRRSSRTGGLMTSRDAGPTTLWFLPAEESKYGLNEWARYIQNLIQRPQSLPTSPTSTASSGFMSQFPSKQDAEEQQLQQSGTKGKLRSKFQSKSSIKSVPQSRDQNSAYASGPPSLRSHRSNLSSKASSMAPAAMSFVQHHTPDLPSPTYTFDEQPEHFIEGWTTAQGRSSGLNSPIRGRGSVGSSNEPSQSNADSSPPAQRETILDRAFQMHYIPGSDREVAGEENLTSLARFEALMREVDSRRQSTRDLVPPQGSLQSAWENDNDEEDSRRAMGSEEDEDSDNYAFDKDTDHDDMGSSTIRALHFITSRHSSTFSDYGMSDTRPQTANTRRRPTAKRTNSQPYIPTTQLSGLQSPPLPTHSEIIRRSHEKRRSVCDVRNLSFNEFTQRLSGTSSLLLAQSNVSGGSNRGSGDYDTQHTPRGSVSPPVTSQPSSDRDERCRWRGSIGVLGNEGGFL